MCLIIGIEWIGLLYIFLKMKHDKVFVRYKNFHQTQPYTRQRESKKGMPDKKKYAQKSNKLREVVRQIIDSFQPLEEIPSNISKLIDKYPKFFNHKNTLPEKDYNEPLNQFIIFNAKKFLEGLNNKKQLEPGHSQSDPDWNSDDDVDGNMESKLIDAVVIQKVVEKLAVHPIKKHQTLKRHQKEFLEDYFRAKRLQQQEESQAQAIVSQQKKVVLQEAQVNQSKSSKEITKPLPQPPKPQTDKPQEKPKNIWSQYQEKQVNSFVDMGFMTKVEDNQEEIEAELAEDDGMFCDDEDLNNQKEEEPERSPSDSQGDQDIFGDECPTTTIKASNANSKPKVQNEPSAAQGTVVINTRIFSKIAQQVGLVPARCNWIISNENYKYKVTSDYMDIYYRKQKMNEVLPYISLNHSDFVRNDEVQSQSALEIFRKFNSRKQKKDAYPSVKAVKHQYKQKTSSHNQKK